jgi:hypothetical protein
MKLLRVIQDQLDLIKDFKAPENVIALERFSKNVQQGSVEPFAIGRRHYFLKKAFDYYLDPKTKGEIIVKEEDEEDTEK